MTEMPKRKKNKFRAVKAVKAMARERVGSPPPGQVVEDRRRKKTIRDKHKKNLSRILSETEVRS